MLYLPYELTIQMTSILETRRLQFMVTRLVIAILISKHGSCKTCRLTALSGRAQALGTSNQCAVPCLYLSTTTRTETQTTTVIPPYNPLLTAGTLRLRLWLSSG